MRDAGEYGFTGWMLFPYTAPYPMLTLDAETGQAALQIQTRSMSAGWRIRLTISISAIKAGRRSS